MLVFLSESTEIQHACAPFSTNPACDVKSEVTPGTINIGIAVVVYGVLVKSPQEFSTCAHCFPSWKRCAHVLIFVGKSTIKGQVSGN